VLTAVSFGIDLAATALGAKRVGASRLAIARRGDRHTGRRVLRSARPPDGAVRFGAMTGELLSAR
jgi:hypothetical protein